MKYCSQCGAQLVDEAVVCPQCGCPVQPQRSVDPNASPKSRLIALCGTFTDSDGKPVTDWQT